MLRLVHAFSELGPLHSQAAVAGGPFPELVRFLQLTDAAEHSNTGVVAMFFEVSLRYLKYLDPAAVARLLQALLGRRGVQAAAAHQRVRDRAAYCVLKVVEGTNWKTVPFGADVHLLLSGQVQHHATDCLCVLLCLYMTSHAPIDRTLLWTWTLQLIPTAHLCVLSV